MTTNERKFLDYTFTKLTGSAYVEEGIFWRDRYYCKCTTLLFNIKVYLNSFKRTFGEPTLKDIEHTIFAEIITITARIDVTNLSNVAEKYIELIEKEDKIVCQS